MSLPAGPYQSPEEPFIAAVHNAGHALGCVAMGCSVQSHVTGEVCRGNPLGMTQERDRFTWSVICWTGPAAEAVLATRSGTSMQEAAEWMWTLYQAGYSGSPASGGHPEPAESDPEVIAVALSVADANWSGIERIAAALTGTALSGHRMARLSPRLVGHLIGSRTGADIAAAFGVWEPAVGEVMDYRRQAAERPQDLAW